MTKIEKTFADVKCFDGDIWVADYTEATKMLSKDQRRGVVIQGNEFDDIASFHLYNASKVNILSVNFERNKGFFPEGIQDCECMFRPKDVGKGWLLLCELKYCKPANIPANAEKAYKQLLDTWRLLDGKGLYDRKHCRVYLNISIPQHSCTVAPFSAFVTNQDERMKFMKQHRIVLLGVNDIIAVSSGILQVVRPRI